MAKRKADGVWVAVVSARHPYSFDPDKKDPDGRPENTYEIGMAVEIWDGVESEKPDLGTKGKDIFDLVYVDGITREEFIAKSGAGNNFTIQNVRVKQPKKTRMTKAEFQTEVEAVKKTKKKEAKVFVDDKGVR